MEDCYRPYVVLTHRPTGKSVRVGRTYANSMGRQRSIAVKILRAMVMSPDATEIVIRKYDLTPGMTRIVDTRTGKEIHGDDVAAVLNGDLELMR